MSASTVSAEGGTERITGVLQNVFHGFNSCGFGPHVGVKSPPLDPTIRTHTFFPSVALGHGSFPYSAPGPTDTISGCITP